MPHYKVQLTPTDPYFFGGEKHKRELDKNGNPVADYYVRSNDFPQQTTLLGAVRYFLLKNAPPSTFSNDKIVDKTAAENLIGKSSFRVQKEEQSFGIIESIGPLYLMYQGTPYFFAPLDYKLSLSEQYILHKGDKAFSPKNESEYIFNQVTNEQGDSIDWADICKSQWQVGNRMDADEAGYYKQELKSLKPGWSFCFDLELKDEISTSQKFLKLGGEKSLFKIELNQTERKEKYHLKNYARSQPYIFCISDCFLNDKHVKKASFGVTRYESFRHLGSHIDTENYSGLSSKNTSKSIFRSRRYALLKRGSVLYFSREESRDEVIKELINKNFQKIGFNQFHYN